MKEKSEEKRVAELFLYLTGIDNASLKEREMADAVEAVLDELEIPYTEDDTWKRTGGNAGNIFAKLEGEGEPMLLCAHLDSVAPALGKKAVWKEDGTITSSGDTVLGADDLAGVAEILETLRRLKERNIPHRPIEVLFTYAEELYDVGSEFFDFSQIRSKEAYVLDASGCTGTFLYKAPTIVSFEVQIRGLASHAGFQPEKGIHAIQIAADAIGSIQMGHVEEDTTVNVGEISGGTGTNIVPERCEVRGEIRSYVHEKALEQMNRMEEIFRTSAGRYGGEAEVTCRIGTYAYETSMESTVVRRMRAVCKKLGFSFLPKESFGGSDNNVLAAHGIEGIVLACGMEQVHSVQEYTTVQALKETAELLIALACPETEEKIC